MSLAVIYAYYNPKSGNNSLNAKMQISYCRNYCKFHDIAIDGEYKDEEIYEEYIENQEGFQEAIDQACKRKAIFIVYSLSKFARTTRDAIIYSEHLHKAGADLVSLKEDIDTKTATGRLFFAIVASLAELEYEQIIERTKGAMCQYPLLIS